MATVTELRLRLERLKKARDSGVLTVRHGDTSTTFRSLSELERIILEVEKEIAAAEGRRRTRVHYVRQDCKDV